MTQDKSKPGYYEYKNMPHEFRPFVMFANAENYSTSVVNTDKFGFRKTFYKDRLIGLDEIKKYTEKQNIIVGGSTAFGMGSTSDNNTIHSYLSKFGNFCFSLGVRAATSQQELILYLQFKRYFNKIKNIIIISGLNDLGLCSQKDSMFYPEFGGVYSEDMNFSQFWFQYNAFQKNKWKIGKSNLYHLIEFLSNKFAFFRLLLSFFFSRIKKSKYAKKIGTLSNLNFDSKLMILREIIKNDLDTWSTIAKQKDINIIYILQPNIYWTKKNLTPGEKIIVNNVSSKSDFQYENLTDIKNYENHRNFLQKTCKENFIQFYDSNEWLNDAGDKQIFIDFCHLHDNGNLFISKKINELLKL